MQPGSMVPDAVRNKQTFVVPDAVKKQAKTTSDGHVTHVMCFQDRPNQNQNLKRDNNRALDDRLRDLPEWLEGFTNNLENTEMPALAHFSQDSDSERPSKVALRKHGVCTHFPNDRNCEVCLRTKITRAPCRRRAGEAVPRAQEFGDFTTADHKVLNEEGEPRNNHQYAVVQDLASQWSRSYPCPTKISQWTEKSSRKFLEPTERPKVVYTNNPFDFGKSCEELSWNHRTSTPHRSETNGFAERAVRRVKEGTSAVLLQSDLDEEWWADSMECCCYL